MLRYTALIFAATVLAVHGEPEDCKTKCAGPAAAEFAELQTACSNLCECSNRAAAQMATCIEECAVTADVVAMQTCTTACSNVCTAELEAFRALGAVEVTMTPSVTGATKDNAGAVEVTMTPAVTGAHLEHNSNQGVPAVTGAHLEHNSNQGVPAVTGAHLEHNSNQGVPAVTGAHLEHNSNQGVTAAATTAAAAVVSVAAVEAVTELSLDALNAIDSAEFAAMACAGKALGGMQVPEVMTATLACQQGIASIPEAGKVEEECKDDQCLDASNDGFVEGAVCEQCDTEACHSALESVNEGTFQKITDACKGFTDKMAGMQNNFTVCVTKAFEDVPATERQHQIDMNSDLEFDFSVDTLREQFFDYAKTCGITPTLAPSATFMKAKVKKAQKKAEEARRKDQKAAVEQAQRDGKTPEEAAAAGKTAVEAKEANGDYAQFDKKVVAAQTAATEAEEVSGSGASPLSASAAAVVAAGFALLW